MPQAMQPRQLPLVPPPPITEADVLAEAERLRLERGYFRRRYRSLDELLADPERARWFLICAKRVLIARLDASR